MELSHFRHWPPDLPRSLRAPSITLHEAFLRSARRFPGKPAAVFEGKNLSYKELQDQVENLAGYLQASCGVKPGDRVLLDMQNGHDFVIACFAILRADAVVVLFAITPLAEHPGRLPHDRLWQRSPLTSPNSAPDECVARDGRE